MSDIDWKLYRLIERCAAAGKPITWCGDDPTRKWELIALLEQQLANVGSDLHEQEEV